MTSMVRVRDYQTLRVNTLYWFDAHLKKWYIWWIVYAFPAGTQHQNDVVSTSMRRDHVASRWYDVILTLCSHWVDRVNTVHWCDAYLKNNIYIYLMNCICPERRAVKMHNAATTWENIPSDICSKRRLKSACASSQSDQSLRCPHEKTLHPWFMIQKCAQWGFWSDCTNAQADLNLRWAHVQRYVFWSFGSVEAVCASLCK